jgi:quercetin dioxygenase-like cupin family protein
MVYSRRELSLLLPALMAGGNNVLPSKVYEFDKLPVKTNPKTHAQSRQVFHGTTHTGCPLDLHITTLPPGQMPHAAHSHEHEEMMFIKEGTLQATINGHNYTAGPGSVIYVASNEMHGLKNVGDTPAQYFVLAIQG